MSPIADNIAAVRQRIALAAQQYARDPSTVSLIAASKSVSAERIAMAHSAGQRIFAESYVQEAVEKIRQLEGLRDSIEWHFIGPLQSNKARHIAEHFDWVHSVDRLKIARRLSELRPASLPELQFCIQVNIDGESTKSGLPPEAVVELAKAVQGLPGMRLRGLMAIPAPHDTAALQREAFARVAELAQHVRDAGIAVDTLSMGMSDDLEAAIAEGATMVRVGTAIFGHRVS